MRMIKSALAGVAAVTLMAAPARAATIYTDQASFLADVAAGYYLETFDGLAQGTNLGTPLNFSDGSFSYSASAPNGFFNVGPGGDTWLSIDDSFDRITFTFTSGNVTAVGGFFFSTDIDGAPSGGTVIATLNDGSQVVLNSSSPTSFAGFISTIPILSLIVDAPAVPSWPTVNDLIVGQSASVPEPSMLLLAGLGGLTWLSRRRRVSR